MVCDWDGSARTLTAKGRVFAHHSADEIPLLRAMPGARRVNAGCWQVSLREKDRRALLELADHLGLDVPPELRNLSPTEASVRALQLGLYPFQVEGADWLSRRS